ncbi:RIP metalloprotease RseP [Aureibacillus halotolerans]|uniref:Zinc metalloprotease n=1 Tax=Aureibacillus halotolerans TaxID=1508390 RepID=A0A4R6U098_9BACI|nr:RIP metalloprotease RseP [Aureibacillus halotolerans]TDQ39680.1 regulator of sigma E protease [Aureibacillus halotolerans]
MTTVIAFIIIFGALVFFHELGHLIFAKRSGMLAREFAIGMGPKMFSFFRNETLYTIRMLPVGGFVRVAGEDPEIVEIKPGHHIAIEQNAEGLVTKIIVNNKSKHQNARIIEVEEVDLNHKLVIRGSEHGLDDEEQVQTYQVHEKAMFVVDDQATQIAPYNRQFASKSIPQRFMQIFAGPMMNFILAAILLIVVGLLAGTASDTPVIGNALEDGAAVQAGLQQGDRITAIDDQPIASWQDIQAYVIERPNQELSFTIDRDGNEMTVAVTPKEEMRQDQPVGIIGVTPMMEHSIIGSITGGIQETVFFGQQILSALGKLVTGQFSIEALSGPVGIYDQTNTFVESGMITLVRWAAFLSINLGIINLLPLPALDGGRIMFILLEAVRGKPIDPGKEGFVHFVGFALLFLLMIVVTWNDIQRLF